MGKGRVVEYYYTHIYIYILRGGKYNSTSHPPHPHLSLQVASF